MTLRLLSERLSTPLIAALTLCALAACEADEPPDPIDEAAVTLMQYTHDQVNRMMVVKIKAGERAVRIRDVEVVSGGFTGRAGREYDATVRPHRTLDLRVPLGPARCDQRMEPGDVSVEFRTEGDSMVVVEPQGRENLVAIHDSECAAEHARAAVPMEWAAAWHTTGTGRELTTHAQLVIGPVASGTAATVTALEGSVIFVPEVASLPVALTPGDTARLDVRFRPNRCDAHVWETSRGFQFAVRLAIDGAEDDVLVPVVPDRAAQQLLTRSWQEQCGVERAPQSSGS